MKRILLSYVCIPIAVLFLFFFGEVVFSFCFQLLSGWCFFLRRVIPLIRIDWSAIILGVASFAGLVWGCRWLGRLISAAHNALGSSSPSAHTHIEIAVEAMLPSELPETATRDPEPRLLPLRASLVMAGLVVTLCVVSIAATATVHASYWLMAADPPDMKIDVPFRGYTQTRINLKSIGLALQQYHDAYGSFPTGGTFLADGTQGHSWMTRLAPFVDRADLSTYIRASEPWYSEHNAPAFRSEVLTYRYPSRYPPVTSDGSPVTCFAANQYVMGANTSCSIKQIYDGLSNTLAVGEVRDNPRSWGDPRNYRDPFLGINQSPHGFGTARPNAEFAIFLLCDGSVSTISAKIDPKVLGALGTPNGGEDIPSGLP